MKDLTNRTDLLSLFQVGDFLFLKDDTDFAFRVLTATLVEPLFGDEGRRIRFATAVQEALDTVHSEPTNAFNPNREVVTEDGVTVVSHANTLGVTVPDATRNRKNKKVETLGKIPVTYQTVYSNYRTATDVVTAVEPTAVGFVEGHAELWADYLAGGKGALNDKQLESELFDWNWKSVCCDAYSKTVAGIRLCRSCGGEFVPAGQSEGA